MINHYFLVKLTILRIETCEILTRQIYCCGIAMYVPSWIQREDAVPDCSVIMFH